MKTTLPLLFVAAIGLASCSKSNDDAKPNNASLIVGTWKLAAQRTVTAPKNGGATTTRDQTVTPTTLSLTYASNGTTQGTAVGIPLPAGTYSISGNTLTTVSSGSTGVSTISELTANRLVLVDFSDDQTSRYTVTSTFTK